MPYLLGVSIGFAVMVFAVGLVITGLFKPVPARYTTLVVSIAYLGWLAWRIAWAGEFKAGGGAGRSTTFLVAAAFQRVNTKAWIMAVRISTTYLVAGHFWTSLAVVRRCFWSRGFAPRRHER